MKRFSTIWRITMQNIEDSCAPASRLAALIGVAAFAACAMLAAPAPAQVPTATHDKIGTAANFLMLPPDEQPGSFRNTDKLFATRTFKHGGSVFPLPAADVPLTESSYRAAGKVLGIADFMRRNRVSGLLVIDHGRIALERYGLGNDENSRWNSFPSVSPSSRPWSARRSRTGPSAASKIRSPNICRS